ncbi:MAG: aldo/keto reductase [Anaerolineae bacterium]|nr:aldo/keto reductase [Anaerolineae bacterium]
MQKRTLGNSGVELTVLGLGTWAIGGGDNPYGWGKQDDKESIDTIRHALDKGINWLDTAAGYGHGHSEEIVGEAVAGRRYEVFIATKCGILWKDDGSDIYPCLKAESIKQEVELSLKRLKTDYIDLYQIHWPTGNDDDIYEGWGAIADLIKAGKVRFGGVSNFNVKQLEIAQKIHPVTSLQPPYSMLVRGIEDEIMDYCGKNKIGIIAYSPMQAGLLTGKMTRERVMAFPDDDWRKTKSPHFQEPALSINLDLIEKLKPIAAKHNRPLSHLALAWVLRRPEVTGAIVGSRRPSQVDETIGAGDFVLPKEDIEAIDKLLKERDEALKKAGVG